MSVVSKRLGGIYNNKKIFKFCVSLKAGSGLHIEVFG